MRSTMIFAAACAVASGSLASPLGAADAQSVATGSGCGGELSASAALVGHSVQVRVTHRPPAGMRGAGAHVHVCIRGSESHADLVRGIAPRSPKAHLRQPADQIILSVPIGGGDVVRSVRVACVHGPHAACLASGAHGS